MASSEKGSQPMCQLTKLSMLNVKSIKFLLNLFHGVVSIVFFFFVHIFMNFSPFFFLYKYSTSHISLIYFLYHAMYENFFIVELHKVVSSIFINSLDVARTNWSIRCSRVRKKINDAYKYNSCTNCKRTLWIFKVFEKYIEQTKFNHYKSTIGDFVLI